MSIDNCLGPYTSSLELRVSVFRALPPRIARDQSPQARVQGLGLMANAAGGASVSSAKVGTKTKFTNSSSATARERKAYERTLHCVLRVQTLLTSRNWMSW